MSLSKTMTRIHMLKEGHLPKIGNSSSHFMLLVPLLEPFLGETFVTGLEEEMWLYSGISLYLSDFLSSS